jgi:hypothetical protein
MEKGVDIEVIYDGTRDNLEELLNMSEFISTITEKSLGVIKYALEENKDKIRLFNIINLGIYVEIDKSNYKGILQKIMSYYSELEEYEMCSEVEKLIKKL